MNKVVVSGGAGFIGSHICDYYIKNGCEVIAIDNLSSGNKLNLNATVKLVQLDIRDAAAYDFIKKYRPDIFIHAAAQMSVSDSMKDPKFDADVNICGLLNVLSAIKATAHITYLLFISTGGAIYGEQSSFPAPETHNINPTSFYGLSKYAGELYLDLWSKAYGLDYGVVRLANVYGPKQNPHGEAGVVAIFNKILLSGKIPTINGDGGCTRDYVYVADVVGAVTKLIASRKKLTLNIGTGLETSVNQLYDKILEVLNLNLPANYGPARSGDQLRSCIDATLARQEIGWQPEFDLTTGLKLTGDWFRNNTDLK